ncbi:MAG TPA: hypothetical protein VHR36_09800 [Pyrinomonadaceae bacterium]|nr:hypothetical protein [Pyrinomonadaceae bacterium]
MINNLKSGFGFALWLLFALAMPYHVWAQDKPVPPPPVNAKTEAIVNHAIQALGGSNYLNIQTSVGRGFFTAFQDGVSQLPARFLDYIAFPDRERTEFVSQGIRVVQTNTGDSGWLFDGATKSLHDMKPAQIADFKRSMRTSVENLLRGWWKKEGATISYAGRREAGVGKRNETVRLTYPDGFWVEYEFGAKDGLPAKIIYKRTQKKEDSDETQEFNEEDRLGKPITVQGITAPWVVDHYINGVQTSRISYESLEYNQPLADSLFAKPANIKALK